MKKYFTKKHLSLEIATNENWSKFNHKQERTYRNVDDNWKSKLTNLTNTEKSKLLFKYAYEGNLKMIKAIINSDGEKCNVDYFDKDNNSALMYAIKSGKKDVVEYIAQRTKNINYLNNRGISPLQLAVRKNSLPLVKVLVESGADLNFKDKDGRTVLYDAVAENNTHMIQVLACNGCSVNIFDKNGISPLMYSVEQTNRQLAMMELLTLNADVNAQCPLLKRNALMYAILKDNRSAMDILLKNGANLNAQDKHGKTPLMYCAKLGNREGIRVLISRGANIFIKDTTKKSALDIAKFNSAHGSAEILAKAEKIMKSNISETEKRQQLKAFAMHNKVQNSCAK